jgi:hypothetical protein
VPASVPALCPGLFTEQVFSASATVQPLYTGETSLAAPSRILPVLLTDVHLIVSPILGTSSSEAPPELEMDSV